MSTDKDWKSKYFDSLKELEKMEKSWVELEDMLRKTISRLSITAKGIHPQLDNVLSDIQTHTRSKKDDLLQQDVEKLTQVLNRIDDQAAATETSQVTDSAQQDEANDNNFALELIQKLDIGADFQPQLESFRNSVPQLQQDQCLSELAGLINQLLQLDDSDTTDRNQAFNVLITLVEKMTLTYGHTPELDELQEKLENPAADDDWRVFLDKIIQQIRVIIHNINTEKVELEGLIVDVTRQLGEISNALNDEHADSLQGRKETRQLQNIMDKSVHNIQQQVQSESDINQLKSTISDNLVSIKSGLTDFVTNDAKRFEKAEQRNQKLQQQIQFMEQESEQLKQKLSENRQKLMYDSLTGVRNRLSYEELLEQELSRYARYKETFSFAVLDIDHFKQVNDNFGHTAGDKALQIVARMMAKTIRKTDFLFRIGGEEFVLLLPKTSLENAAPLVEKIRVAVGQASFHFKQQRVEISLSAGLTSMRDNDSGESIYERADKALYQAKNGGRDRLVVTEA